MLLTREQLQDRLIALHRASLELVQDISLESLLERIAATACQQAEARYAAVGVLDDDGNLKQFITHGITEDEIRRMPHPPKGLGLIGALMNATETINLPDLTLDARSVGFPPGHPPMRSFLGVPIRSGGKQLGQIYLTEKIGFDRFTADDELIIEMLAAYAATAIKNARQYEEICARDAVLMRRAEDMELLNNIATALTSSLEMEEILNRTLGLVINYLKVEAGELFLLEEDKRTLSLVLHRGQAAEAFWTRSRFSVGEGIVGLVAQTGETIVSNDLANDVRYLRDAVVEAGFRQLVCIPLKSGDAIMGVLSMATRGRSPFDERDIQLLNAVGHWAGLAIENARLHSNARRSAVLEERERIGMDLHDGVIQSIFGVGLSLENLSLLIDENPQAAKERIQQAIGALNQTIRDIRAYILDLRPRQMGGEGLVDGIKRLLAEFRSNTLTETYLTCPKEPLNDLPPTHALTLFHICQEALANIAKHANAKRVDVAVFATDERVLMEIRDDGRGFDLEKMNLTIGHGLANMQTRAHSVGGEVDIASTLGEGTAILAWVPRNLTT